jgi:transcriptional regulator of acetoin/glycerol metabolism
VEELQNLLFQHRGCELKSINHLQVSNTLLTFREEMEKKEIQKALEEANGKAQEAIKKLCMPKSTFYRKLKKYQL